MEQVAEFIRLVLRLNGGHYCPVPEATELLLAACLSEI